MKLSEVYGTGATEAQGTVKYTYAELFNEQGQKLYSLNKDRLGYNVVVVTDQQPNANGMVEVAVTPKTTQDIFSTVKNGGQSKINQYTDGKPIFVKESAIDWDGLDESNLTDGGTDAPKNQEPKANKTVLYVGLGLLALSLLK